MKKWIIIILAVLITGGLIAALIVVKNIEKEENEGKKVESVEEFLSCMEEYCRKIQLTCDLDFSGYEWVPMDRDMRINGNGYQLANITVNADDGDNIGMIIGDSRTIVELENVKITNLVVNYNGTGKNIGGIAGSLGDLTLKNVEISGEVNAPAAENVGGIAGYCEYISNENTNIQVDVDVLGGENVGGAIGKYFNNYGYSIENIHNKGDVQALKAAAGGVVGNADTDGDKKLEIGIINCSNEGDIQAKSYVGGIVGIVQQVKVENCTNSGDVKAIGLYNPNTYESNAGGIIGGSLQADIFACTNSGKITGEYDCVGGIAGNAGSTDRNYNGDDHRGENYSSNKNTGSVQGRDHVGGILGKCYGKNAQMITTNENTGDVRGASNVAGIVGYLGNHKDTKVVYCKNSGNIESTISRVAAFIGRTPRGNFEEMDTNTNTGSITGAIVDAKYHIVED